MQELFVQNKDTSLEDYSQFETLYQYLSISRQFVEASLPFWEMKPSDQLISGENPIYGGSEVFSKSGNIYAVYLPSADPTPTIDLSGIDGKFNKSWFNPRNGGFEGETEMVSAGGQLSIGSPPSSNQEDWVVLLTLDTCPGDINFDKDVDGKDIADNILDSGGLDLEVFANNFGKVNCP